MKVENPCIESLDQLCVNLSTAGGANRLGKVGINNLDTDFRKLVPLPKSPV